MQTGLIYVHKNKTNGKCYVGQTIKQNPNARWENGSGYIRQTKFWNAIQKYGWDGFEHIILETDIPIKELSERENYYINFYNAIDNGYNVEFAGNNIPISETTKQKIKDSWTPERRQAQSERAKKQWQDNPEYREKMREVAKNIPRRDISGENNPMYGTHRTGADAAHKRSVQCIETGEIFPTVTAASIWCSGNKNLKSKIALQIRGKRKSCGKHPETNEPLHWRYID